MSDTPSPAVVSAASVPGEIDASCRLPVLVLFSKAAGWLLVASHYGTYPHTDRGVEVRRVFHKLRSLAIENRGSGSSPTP